MTTFIVILGLVTVWIVRGQIDKRRERKYIEAEEARVGRIALVKLAKEQLKLLREHCSRQFDPKNPLSFGLRFDNIESLLRAKSRYGVLEEIGTTEEELNQLSNCVFFWGEVGLSIHNLKATCYVGSTFNIDLLELTEVLTKYNKTLKDIGMTQADIEEIRQEAYAKGKASAQAKVCQQLIEIVDELRKEWLKEFGQDISGYDFGLAEVYRKIDLLP